MKEFNNKIKDTYLYIFNQYIKSMKINHLKNDKNDSYRTSNYEKNINNYYLNELILFEKKLIFIFKKVKLNII